MNEFYQFEPEHAMRFAHSIGAQTKQKGDELTFQVCPYCKSTKDKGTFSINLRTGAFHCLRAGCNVSGNMLTLARDFNFSISDDVDRYLYNKRMGGAELKMFRLKHVESKDAAVRYMQSRGISERVTRDYEITVQDNAENILSMPFRDQNGVCRFIKYRKTDFDKEKDKAKEWSQKDGSPILYGMWRCTDNHKQLVITEGQMDSLSVVEAGIPNAVSVPTGANGHTWIANCWDWWVQWESIVIFGDCEKGHITLVDTVGSRFPKTVKIVREEDYRGCKDANDLLRTYGAEAVRYAVEHAEGAPVASVVSMADIAYVKLYELEAIRTQIKSLDLLLIKGFYYGQVILLTGKRGDGKSTFLNQIICNAIDQGIKTLIYSGELAEYNVRNWVDTQLAGCHENEITMDMSNKIAEWYRNKLYILASKYSEEDELTSDRLLNQIEKAIVQMGIRLIAVDNLMTVVESGENETLFRKQSQFVGKLKLLAKTYNCVIILVAHPRKSQGFVGFQNDDVAGSSDITNKVDIVMAYQRLKPQKGEEEQPDRRELIITKNRLTGRLAVNNKAIQLKYHTASRRIVDTTEDFNKVYGWNKDGFRAVRSDDEIPDFME